MAAGVVANVRRGREEGVCRREEDATVAAVDEVARRVGFVDAFRRRDVKDEGRRAGIAKTFGWGTLTLQAGSFQKRTFGRRRSQTTHRARR